MNAIEAPGVELRNIVKTFAGEKGKTVAAVDDVSFSVRKGELVTLLGPSGCGKTTLLRILGGFETQTSGDAFVDGRSMGNLPPNRRDTSMMFQSYALFPHMSAFENVAYGLRVRKTPPGELKARVFDMLKVMGLEGLENRTPGRLSGGQQQRVALARALVTRPSVLLLDEPLSNLDAKLRVSARREVRRIQKELGITAIYVTHDQEEAVHVSDRIVVMNRGRVEQIGGPEEIYRKPKSRFAADFFGKVNFIEAEILSVDGGKARARILGREWDLEAEEGLTPGPATVAARPEAILLREPGGGAEGLDGTVREASFGGDRMIYEVASQGVSLTVEAQAVPGEKAFGAGSSVRLAIDPRALRLLPR